MITTILYIVFATIVAISMRRPLRALVDARRQSVDLRKALAAAEEDPSEPFAHLSPGLARLAQDTQVLRNVLEEPLQAARAWSRADDSPLLNKVDLGDGSDLDRCDDFDIALVNARQAIWEWVSSVAALSDHDRATLEELGLSDRPARELLAERDAFRRLSRAPKRELARVEAQLRPLLSALDFFEAGLLRQRATFYR
ncbi:MAG: hypothetical protein H6710_10415 [Myxococcales bacterium]|nr:hypothetical protein [Myxococcales bacterium]MCB9702579.1 hypothetical protein [Myxococcales bacterium]